MSFFQALISLLLILICPIAGAESFVSPKDQESVEEIHRAYVGVAQIEKLVSADRRDRQLLQRHLKRPVTLTPGFASPEDPSLPAAVRAAAESVFMIYIVRHDLANTEIYPLNEVRRAQVDFLKLGTPEGEMKSELMGFYLGRCLRERAQYCRVPKFEGFDAFQGSAFLIGSEGRDVYTSKHVYSKIMGRFFQTSTWTAELADLNFRGFRENFHVFLFDRGLGLVSTPDLNPLTAVACGENNSLGDYFKLQAPVGLGRGLKFASQRPSHGTPAFHLGFAGGTGTQSRYSKQRPWSIWGTRYPHPDAMTSVLTVTRGIYFDTPSEMIASDADGMVGMSGGPSLNAEGEVVGMIQEVKGQKYVPPSRIGRTLVMHETASIPFWKLTGKK